MLFDGADGLRGYLNYNTDLFDSTTIRRMAGHFRTLIEGIAANPDARISELPLFDSAERNKILLEWNDTYRDYSRDVRLHELIEAQVERTPDAVAVVFEDERLTYREVNRRANRLAHRLRKLGVGPEVIVGVFAERSVEMVVGLVATLKAGGAYLPLDPSYPAERLSFMLSDAQPIIVLVQTQPGCKVAAVCRRSRFPRGRFCGGERRESHQQHAAGESCLRDLHLRFHGAAQRCHEHAPRHLQSTSLDAGDLPTHHGRPRAAKDAVHIRRVGVGVFLAAAHWRTAGCRATRAAWRQPIPHQGNLRERHHNATFRSVNARGLPRRQGCRALFIASARNLQWRGLALRIAGALFRDAARYANCITSTVRPRRPST